LAIKAGSNVNGEPWGATPYLRDGAAVERVIILSLGGPDTGIGLHRPPVEGLMSAMTARLA